VIEAYVPAPSFFDRGQRVHALSAPADSATIEVYRVHLAAQRFHSQKITFDADGVHLRPHAKRYCRPAELALMADRADLTRGLLDVNVSSWREGGQVELHVWSGAFHRCDEWVPKAVISRAAHRARVSWLRRMPATAEGRDTR
jgi:hypothetical protein